MENFNRNKLIYFSFLCQICFLIVGIFLLHGKNYGGATSAFMVASVIGFSRSKNPRLVFFLNWFTLTLVLVSSTVWLFQQFS
jgi:hypothetical protein